MSGQMHKPSKAAEPVPEPEDLAPADYCDPVIEAYKKDVDRTLLIANLKLTPAERAEKFQDFMKFLEEVRRAGRKLRGEAE